jgi:hypothetical protein
MHQTSDKSKFRSGMVEPNRNAPRSGFDEALQKFLHKVVQRTDASAMKTRRAHAAIATLHASFESELASGGIQIQKQDGAIGVSATEILVFTNIHLAPVHETDGLASIRLGYIKNQRLSVFELCLKFGKTMLPVESREIIPILFVEFFAFRFSGKDRRSGGRGCR